MLIKWHDVPASSLSLLKVCYCLSEHPPRTVVSLSLSSDAFFGRLNIRPVESLVSGRDMPIVGGKGLSFVVTRIPM